MSLIKLSLLLLLTFAIFTTSVYTQEAEESDFDSDELNKVHKCTHDDQDIPEPELLEVDEGLGDDQEGRTLANLPNLRTYGYYGELNSVSTTYANYISQDLIPPILDYFAAALKNRYPVSGNLKVSSSSVCGYKTPSVLKTGVAADYFYFIETQVDNSGNWVASSVPCTLASGSKRPLIAKTTINTKYIKAGTSNVLLHEKNMICLMHEVTHTLGFSRSLFGYFKGGKISSATLDGASAVVLVAEPLTTKLRNHFGCSTLKGAYMENSGSSGTAGSHFERRQFAHEYMTSGLIYQMQVSELTLALLESSGWYTPDYSYADPYFYGQGQGCNFLTKSCSSLGTSFSEFCSGSSRGCTNVGRGGGSCSSDVRSDSCKFIHANVNYDCENSNGENYARLPSLQTYGRSAGSKCFTGTLNSGRAGSTTSFCFKPTCSGSGTNTQLTLAVGGKSVVCTKKGTVTVSGYAGVINCPDPLAFCNTVGQKICPRGCMGRGSCVNGVCQCKSGFKGTDCALRA